MTEQTVDRYAILAPDGVTVDQIVMGTDASCSQYFPGRVYVRAPYADYFVTIGSTWNAASKSFTAPAE